MLGLLFAIMNKASMSIIHKHLPKNVFSVFLGILLRSRLTESYGGLIFNFLRNVHSLLHRRISIGAQGSNFSTSLPTVIYLFIK